MLIKWLGTHFLGTLFFTFFLVVQQCDIFSFTYFYKFEFDFCQIHVSYFELSLYSWIDIY